MMNTPSMELKKINRNRIFQFILQQRTTSKLEIAQKLGISLPTVTQNISVLKEQNLLVECGEYESTGGRRAKMISCNAMARVALGIDITRNHISIVLVDLLGNVIDSGRESFDCADTIKTLVKVQQLIEKMLQVNRIDDETVLGVGVSLPAIIGGDCQNVKKAMVFPIPDNYYQMLRPYVRFPYLLYNDANCGGFAELWSRKSIERDVFYLSLSGTVGGAIMINGRIYSGSDFTGGEVGHMTLVPNGRSCYCGKNGCVDSYCNSNYLAELTSGNLQHFFELLSQGDQQATARMEEYLDYLAVVIHNVRMLFDSDIILGGYVGNYSDLLLDGLCRRLRDADTFDLETHYVTGCHHRTEAAAVGAALMYVSQFVDEV